MNTMDSHPIHKSYNIIGLKYTGPTKSYQRVANQLRGPYYFWAYGVVASMFDFHCSDRGLNPSRGGKIS